MITQKALVAALGTLAFAGLLMPQASNAAVTVNIPHPVISIPRPALPVVRPNIPAVKPVIVAIKPVVPAVKPIVNVGLPEKNGVVFGKPGFVTPTLLDAKHVEIANLDKRIVVEKRDITADSTKVGVVGKDLKSDEQNLIADVIKGDFKGAQTEAKDAQKDMVELRTDRAALQKDQSTLRSEEAVLKSLETVQPVRPATSAPAAGLNTTTTVVSNGKTTQDTVIFTDQNGKGVAAISSISLLPGTTAPATTAPATTAPATVTPVATKPPAPPAQPAQPAAKPAAPATKPTTFTSVLYPADQLGNGQTVYYKNGVPQVGVPAGCTVVAAYQVGGGNPTMNFSAGASSIIAVECTQKS
jgi:hypothetical protein